ncbi:hypothetical protein VKT23_020031 [Stygiomarasmius scandens]|uniref:Uncharacterized protein n=1 Tax=Marasmiellus scandens TaxID=2682957 RepID=A0ABR1ILA7_9AGAR
MPHDNLRVRTTEFITNQICDVYEHMDIFKSLGELNYNHLVMHLDSAAHTRSQYEAQIDLVNSRVEDYALNFEQDIQEINAMHFDSSRSQPNSKISNLLAQMTEQTNILDRIWIDLLDVKFLSVASSRVRHNTDLRTFKFTCHGMRFQTVASFMLYEEIFSTSVEESSSARRLHQHVLSLDLGKIPFPFNSNSYLLKDSPTSGVHLSRHNTILPNEPTMQSYHELNTTLLRNSDVALFTNDIQRHSFTESERNGAETPIVPNADLGDPFGRGLSQEPFLISVSGKSAETEPEEGYGAYCVQSFFLDKPVAVSHDSFDILSSFTYWNRVEKNEDFKSIASSTSRELSVDTEISTISDDFSCDVENLASTATSVQPSVAEGCNGDTVCLDPEAPCHIGAYVPVGPAIPADGVQESLHLELGSQQLTTASQEDPKTAIAPEFKLTCFGSERHHRDDIEFQTLRRNTPALFVNIKQAHSAEPSNDQGRKIKSDTLDVASPFNTGLRNEDDSVPTASQDRDVDINADLPASQVEIWRNRDVRDGDVHHMLYVIQAQQVIRLPLTYLLNSALPNARDAVVGAMLLVSFGIAERGTVFMAFINVIIFLAPKVLLIMGRSVGVPPRYENTCQEIRTLVASKHKNLWFITIGTLSIFFVWLSFTREDFEQSEDTNPWYNGRFHEKMKEAKHREWMRSHY